jgi:hypothetical protein
MKLTFQPKKTHFFPPARIFQNKSQLILSPLKDGSNLKLFYRLLIVILLRQVLVPTAHLNL